MAMGIDRINITVCVGVNELNYNNKSLANFGYIYG